VKVETVEFVLSAARTSECPADPLPEIAVSGRSNVGKSSLLNMLFRRRGLAKTSGTPGKTQNLNYYLVNGRFHLVDLPGYGYARAPVDERNRWGRMMQGYLRTRPQLVGVVQLVDCRHEPSREDREMVAWLRDERVPYCLVATKVDKLGRGARADAARTIATALGPYDPRAVLQSSGETGEGREAILGWVAELLAAVKEG
jgi:GTP-binding protein